MNKAVISNRIFLPKTEELFSKCVETLTYVIPARNKHIRPEIICDITIVSKHIFSIPVSRTDLIPKGFEIVDKRTTNSASIPKSTVHLREGQLDVYNNVTDNCLINAKPGWGKTFVALSLAEKFAQKTLVVVHNVSLRDQWVEETEKIFGFTPGIIGSGKADISTPIVISNVQTLTKVMNDYAGIFGLLIVDEVHHTPASTFKKVVDTSRARYKIGLSGTLNRKDLKHVMTPDYFSTTVYKPAQDNEMKPSVLVVHTGIPLPSVQHWAIKINDLTANPRYIELVSNLAKAQQELGHKVLVVGDRVDFLKKCANKTKDAVAITGECTNRKEIHKKFYTDELSVLYGTTSIYKEGISINPLSCVILGSPVNNLPLLEQLIGRITRPHENKPSPVIVDIALKGSTSKHQLAQRMGYYIDKGYKIVEIRDD